MPLNARRGWSKHAHNKSKMADGPHFKKLSNGSTNPYEIWYVDAFNHLKHTHNQNVHFKKSKMADGSRFDLI